MVTKKRILFLSNRGLLPIKDGHTRRSFNILKGLALNNQVYFLSLFETPEEVAPENIEELEQLCYRVEFLPAPSKKMSAEMLFRLFRSLFSADPYTIWRHYSKRYFQRVNELLLSEQFDLVHCDILPVCYTIRNRNDVFRSLTDHDVSYIKCLRMGKDSGNILLKAFLYLEAVKLKRLERNIFRQVDLGIAVSDLDKEVLQGLCPEGRFLVVENGGRRVEVDRFKPSGEPQVKNRLLWLGGFDHFPNRQGILFFLEKIYPLVKQENHDVSIDIVGGGVTNDLGKFALKDSSINFTGYVDDPLIYLDKAEVFVCPDFERGRDEAESFRGDGIGEGHCLYFGWM